MIYTVNEMCIAKDIYDRSPLVSETYLRSNSITGRLRSLVSKTVEWSNPGKNKTSKVSLFQYSDTVVSPVRYFRTSSACTIWSAPLRTTPTVLPMRSSFHKMFSAQKKCLESAREMSGSRLAKYHSCHSFAFLVVR